MTKIKFGTDGWRAIIAKEFTADNVARVSHGVSKWIKQNYPSNLTVVIGHDCRFAGALFVESATKVFAEHGIKVYMADGFVTTPMISYAAHKLNTALGVIITASHNPPDYNGYKLKGNYGGPLLVKDVDAIEAMIPDQNTTDLNGSSLDRLQQDGALEYIDLEGLYCLHVEKNFDIEAIKNAGFTIAYNAMFGSGQNAMKRLLPEAVFYHCHYNPTFDGIAPEPIMKNLADFSDFIKKNGSIDIALITDGDADRIGLMDGEGNFVDSHHILLLLIHYLRKYKGLTGKVCTGFSSTNKIKTYCKKHDIPLDIVKIGFKYICGIMIEEDVLVGGEESGGIAIKGHIPERDGIWIGLTLIEFMAKSGKSLHDLIAEVYEEVGSFAFQRIDLKLPEDQKIAIVQKCANDAFSAFGSYKVEHKETTDGFKYYFNENEWVMIRPSGTEPVLRTYAESKDKAGAEKILKETHNTILN